MREYPEILREYTDCGNLQIDQPDGRVQHGARRNEGPAVAKWLPKRYDFAIGEKEGQAIPQAFPILPSCEGSSSASCTYRHLAQKVPCPYKAGLGEAAVTTILEEDSHGISGYR